MSDYEKHLVEEVRAGRMTRRDLLRRASVMGISIGVVGSMLAACGGSGTSEPSTEEIATSAAETGADTGAAQATTAASTGDVTPGGIGRFGGPAPTGDLDPVTMFDNGAVMTAQQVGDYLCFPSEDYILEPRLATEWTATKPDVWDFKIRQGVQWHDGSPLTVDDVVYTFKLLTNPDTKSPALSNLGGILTPEGVEAVDGETVRFNLERPFVDFPTLVSGFSYNTIILPANYEIGTFAKGGVGTGPFVLKEFRPKEMSILERNQNYWEPPFPYLDGLEMHYFADTAPTVLALQAGEIDIYPQTPFQGAQALFSDDQIVVLEASSGAYHAVPMRTDREPFTDVRVRQAFALAVNRPAVIDALFGGRSTLGNDDIFAPVFPQSPTTGELPQREQDIAQAKQLLADAGHPDGLNVALTVGRLLEASDYAVILKDQLKEAGINVELNLMDLAAYYGTGDNQPWLDADFTLTGWGTRGAVAQAIEPAFICSGVWNAAHWCNANFDNVVNQFEAELDEQTRKTLALEAAKIMHEEVPNIIAYWDTQLRTTRNNVHGLPKGPDYYVNSREVWLST